MTISAHRLGPGTLKVGDTGTSSEWGSQVTAMKLAASINEEDTTPVLSGEELDGDDTLDWELSGTVLQSFDVAGLVYWSFQNRLKVLTFEFIPSSENSEFKVTGKVKVIPLDLGGDVKKRNTSEFTFKVIGDPEFVEIP